MQTALIFLKNRGKMGFVHNVTTSPLNPSPHLGREYKNMPIQRLLQKYKFKTDEQKLLRAAYDFAAAAHAGQKRKTGEAYVGHSLAAAEKLAAWGIRDVTTLAAGLLHDVPEDTAKTLDDIQKKFGNEICFLVLGVTKLGRIKLRNQNDPAYIETLKRMVLAMAEDIRVVLIKLADRLHNMETIAALPRNKQEGIARETLEIYAPLAARLGMNEVKSQLEDLAFPIVHPKEYNKIVTLVRPKTENANYYIPRAKNEIEKILEIGRVDYLRVEGRPKHMFSLYQKLQRPEYEWDIEKVYDIVAFRIITESVDLCYAALGVIHQYFRPLRERFKDYIAVPKPNGYKSLHTNVFGPEGKYLEIQIRTHEMHNEAEFGIASHWAYVEQGKPRTGGMVGEKQYEWVRQLRDWQRDTIENAEEFMESLKIDFFKNRICVFTPKGDIKDLPEGATTIDFAFAVHSDLGIHCAGAKINGKIRKLDNKLKNGDVVEILEDKKAKVTRDWLKIATTSGARHKIRNWLNKNPSGFISRLTPGFIRR